MEAFQQFRFVADCLDGTGGFRPTLTSNPDGTDPVWGGAESYLVRYPRESAEKYARRQQVAYYRNFLKGACVKFAGYLAKKPPTRELGNPLLKAFADDADWRGNALDVVWADFIVNAKARGSMLLLVDMPKAVPADQGTQIEARAVPYVVPIKPEQVISYKLDSHALIEEIVLADTSEAGEPIYRVWNKLEWWVQKPGAIGDANLILESGEHSLGVCPVLAFTESGTFPSLGEWFQVCELSRRYYNAASERDEILRGQTFSLLTYQVPPEQPGFDAAGTAEAIGTHNMLVHSGDTPAFIAPPDGPAVIYRDMLKDTEADIRKITLTIEQPSQAESGIALTIRFQELNAALTAFARRMEDFERRVWDMVCRWLDLAQQPDIAWAKTYELADIVAEVTLLQNMQAAAFPEEVIREQQKLVVKTQFSNLAPETLDALLQAIDLQAKEAPPA